MLAAPQKYSYMMEGPGEEERLSFKDNNEATLAQLMATGFGKLKHNPYVIDAGAGVGVVARQMVTALDSIYKKAEMSLLDGSSSRLEKAAEHIGNYPNIKTNYIECNLDDIPLPDNTADYIFCRFVFEYLSNPQSVFDELTRVLKVGGKLVIGDLDHNCLNHYPFPEELQNKLDELIKVIQHMGLLDFYAGRKIYHYFYKGGFENIHVNIYPHHLFYGDLRPTDYENWRIKLERLIELQKNDKLDLSYQLSEFKDKYLNFLLSPERFSYTPLILVEGQKP